MIALSSSTRTHVIYQSIILTLLFLSIGYNELLPDRKSIVILTFIIPLFCYQLIVLSCCMGLMPVPRWMRFLQHGSKSESSNDFKCTRSSSSDSVRTSSPIQSDKSMSFPDATEIPSPWRKQKSVTNLGAAAKCFTQSQKSKSWMSLNESKSAERLLSSREGSLDVLVPLSNRKCASSIMKQSNRVISREDRSKKAKSWKPFEANFHVPSKAELTKSVSLSAKASEQASSNCMSESEESELSKSFSFPFRQKRLETWLESKETTDSNQSLDMPYWHSVGYNLAVKYEARRRQRVPDTLDKSDAPNEESVQMVLKHKEALSDAPVPSDRQCSSKKGSKLAAARINKLKVGISNLISKKRDEVSESSSANSNKVSRGSILLKLRNKNASCQNAKEKPLNMPEFPRFLNDDRPQLFYPRYLPFEKERFENDVKNKIKELSEDHKARQNEGKDFQMLI